LGNPEPVDFVRCGALVPVSRVADPLGLIFEFCASLFVLGRTGRLNGSDVLAHSTADVRALVTEVVELYGADISESSAAGGLIYCDELVVPQFWIQAVGAEQTYLDVARSAVGAYAHEFLFDLRDRLGLDEDIERPLVAGPVGYQARYGQDFRRDRNLGEALEDCERARAVLVPPSAGLGLRARAAFYSGLAHLVAINGEDDANIAFMAKGSRVDELFVSDYVVGPSCLVADLLELEYVPAVLPIDPLTAGPPPFTRSPEVTTDVRRTLLNAATSSGGIRPFERIPVWIVTAIGDDDMLLSDWLDYYRAIGASRVIAFASATTESVRALVASDRFADFIDLCPEDANTEEERVAVAERISREEQGVSADPFGEGRPRTFFVPLEQGDFLHAPSLAGLEWKELTAAMLCADEIELPVHRVVGLRSVADHNAGHERLATSSTYRFTEPSGIVVMRADQDGVKSVEVEDDSAIEEQPRDLGPLRVVHAGIEVLRIECDAGVPPRWLIDEAERDDGLSSGRLEFDSSLAHSVLAAKSLGEMTGFAR